MTNSAGTRLDYSNTGYFLLGYIVEKASGETAMSQASTVMRAGL